MLHTERHRSGPVLPPRGGLHKVCAAGARRQVQCHARAGAGHNGKPSFPMNSVPCLFFFLGGNAMAARPLRARPRHAEDQPTSDRAASHAAPTACSRPGPPTTRSGGLRGRRTPSGRRATTRSAPQPTAQPCQPRLRLTATQTGRTAEHSAQHTPARAQHTQTHARFQHAHAHSTRASHASAAPHTEHTCPHQQQPACHNPHLTHARARTLPTPAHALGVAERNQKNQRVGLRP